MNIFLADLYVRAVRRFRRTFACTSILRYVIDLYSRVNANLEMPTRAREIKTPKCTPSEGRTSGDHAQQRTTRIPACRLMVAYDISRRACVGETARARCEDPQTCVCPLANHVRAAHACPPANSGQPPTAGRVGHVRIGYASRGAT